MASFGDMARASKLQIVIVALWACVADAHAQSRRPVGAEVAELQFALARSLAQAGEHDAAAREFDRALALQRQAASATPAQTDAALQTLRAYVQSRPELPRIRELGRQLEATERRIVAMPPAPMLVPNAPIGAAPVATTQTVAAGPMIVPNAPPSAPQSVSVVATARPAAPTRPSRDTRHTATRTSPRANAPWWEQAALSADELLIPAEWEEAGLRRTRQPDSWPQMLSGWPALLIPEGWERPSQGHRSMLLAETELLVPVGW